MECLRLMALRRLSSALMPGLIPFAVDGFRRLGIDTRETCRPARPYGVEIFRARRRFGFVGEWLTHAASFGRARKGLTRTLRAGVFVMTAPMTAGASMPALGGHASVCITTYAVFRGLFTLNTDATFNAPFALHRHRRSICRATLETTAAVITVAVRRAVRDDALRVSRHGLHPPPHIATH